MWRRRRLVVGVLLVVVVGVVAFGVLGRRPGPAPTAPPSPPTAALTAHGQIVPALRAQVGTQGGGVLRQLSVSPGAPTADQTEVARVEGPSGTEVVTAPFRGTVTNVLVHEGDTLLPGAVIAVVADLRTIQVETSDVDQFLVGHVSSGQQVLVAVDALDNLVLAGTVRSVAGLPQADTSGGQHYPVVITLDTVPPEVRAGMSVRVMVPE